MNLNWSLTRWYISKTNQPPLKKTLKKWVRVSNLTFFYFRTLTNSKGYNQPMTLDEEFLSCTHRRRGRLRLYDGRTDRPTDGQV